MTSQTANNRDLPDIERSNAPEGDMSGKQAEFIRLVRENTDLRRDLGTLREEIEKIRGERSILEVEVTGLKQHLQKVADTPDDDTAYRERKGSITKQIIAAAQLSSRLTSLDLGSILSAAVSEIPAILEIDYAAIYLYGENEKRFFLKEQSYDTTARPIIGTEDSILRDAISSGEPFPVIGKDAIRAKCSVFFPAEETLDLKAEGFKPSDFETAAVLPLLGEEGKLVGLLFLADTQGWNVSNAIEPLKHISNSLGSAITNYVLYTQAQTLARTDGITNLLNHYAFFQELRKEVSVSRRYGSVLSLIVADLDDLKIVNDRFGHSVGDKALVVVADVIRKAIRNVDIPARYGGDEFTVILPQTTSAGAGAVARRMIKWVSTANLRGDGEKVPLSISVGVAELAADATPEEFFAAADRALYRAKRKGKNALATATCKTTRTIRDDK